MKKESIIICSLLIILEPLITQPTNSFASPYPVDEVKFDFKIRFKMQFTWGWNVNNNCGIKDFLWQRLQQAIASPGADTFVTASAWGLLPKDWQGHSSHCQVIAVPAHYCTSNGAALNWTGAVTERRSLYFVSSIKRGRGKYKYQKWKKVRSTFLSPIISFKEL